MDFAVGRDTVGPVDERVVAALDGLFDQVGVMVAKVDAGDGADGVLACNCAGQAVCRYAHPHAALDDGKQLTAGESQCFKPHGYRIPSLGNSATVGDGAKPGLAPNQIWP